MLVVAAAGPCVSSPCAQRTCDTAAWCWPLRNPAISSANDTPRGQQSLAAASADAGSSRSHRPETDHGRVATCNPLADRSGVGSARDGVLAHDEVRQRTAISLDIADKPKRHPSARLELDANDLGAEDAASPRLADRDRSRRIRPGPSWRGDRMNSPLRETSSTSPSMTSPCARNWARTRTGTRTAALLSICGESYASDPLPRKQSFRSLTDGASRRNRSIDPTLVGPSLGTCFLSRVRQIAAPK